MCVSLWLVSRVILSTNSKSIPKTVLQQRLCLYSFVHISLGKVLCLWTQTCVHTFVSQAFICLSFDLTFCSSHKFPLFWQAQINFLPFFLFFIFSLTCSFGHSLQHYIQDVFKNLVKFKTHIKFYFFFLSF